MKKPITLLLIIIFYSSLSFGQEENDYNSNEFEALSAKEVVFLGIDFSGLRLIDSFGFIDKNGKSKCAALKYKYYESWNEVFLLESVKFNPNELLIVNTHKLLLTNSLVLNKTISIDTCLITDVSYKISKEEIQSIVNKYAGNIDSEEKIAVLMLSESLSKKTELGVHIVVYFNSKTGEILLSRRYSSPPVGYGFDNYWVNTIHKVLEQHQTYVKKTRRELKIKI